MTVGFSSCEENESNEPIIESTAFDNQDPNMVYSLDGNSWKCTDFSYVSNQTGELVITFENGMFSSSNTTTAPSFWETTAAGEYGYVNDSVIYIGDQTSPQRNELLLTRIDNTHIRLEPYNFGITADQPIPHNYEVVR